MADNKNRYMLVKFEKMSKELDDVSQMYWDEISPVQHRMLDRIEMALDNLIEITKYRSELFSMREGIKGVLGEDGEEEEGFKW